ncbi:hypothetical protein Q8F57_044040 [Paraburkholderia terrae]|uniref:hypothetical protein n=1 Tax=Paraburkholderia terrae TaxID=311230 RepID=UPI00296B338F|nr:hypothetical protein [Paraburkholderia terrae]MDW3661886.1 hypothetical protein [Paraburkholderia terrae]
MERIPNRKYAARLSLVRAGAEKSKGIEDSSMRNQVDELCIALFDRWCERREITPLIYLLYAWPFFASTPQPVRTVLAALDDLSRFHREALDDGDQELIARVLALADD